MSNCWFREYSLHLQVHCSWKKGVDEFSPFSQCTHTQQVDTPWSAFFDCSQDKDIISAISMTNSRFAGKIYFIQIYFGDGMYIIILKWTINSNYEHNMLSTLYFFFLNRWGHICKTSRCYNKKYIITCSAWL